MKKIFYLLIIGWVFYSPQFSHASLIEKKNCSACHRLSKVEKEKKGPDLFYAGNKFQDAWLEEYLQNPVTLRKAGTINSPDFLKGELQNPQQHPILNKNDAVNITQ